MPPDDALESEEEQMDHHALQEPKYGNNESSDAESDESDEEYQAKSARGSIIEMLMSTLKDIAEGTVDLTDKHHLQEFKSNGLEALIRGTGDKSLSKILHILVSEKGLVLPKVADTQMEHLISAIVKHDSDPLSKENSKNETALYQAIELKNEKMIAWMCNAHPNIDSILSKTSNDIPHLHLAIKKRIGYFSIMAKKAHGSTLAIKDNKYGNTVLHLLVEYKRCRKGQLSVIQDIVERSDQHVKRSPRGDFNKAEHSPYIHHLNTVKKARMATSNDNTPEAHKKMSTLEQTRDRDRAKGGYGQNDGPEAYPPGPPGAGPPDQAKKRSQSKSRSKSAVQSNTRAKYTGAQRPPPPVTGADAQPLTPIEAPVTGNTTEEIGHLGTRARRGTFPALSSVPKKQSRVDSTVVEEVRKFLKLHYLRTRSSGSCLEILYTVPEEIELYLDLSGRSSMTASGFEKFVQSRKFESALQYVAIPAIKIEPTFNASSNTRPGLAARDRQANDATGRWDLVQVFDALRKKKNKVEKIIKVFVDDTLSPPHSDEAIEKALDGMDVEVWDWRRTDLSLDVIQKAAPHVRELHLYWGGNNAVLKGWSEESGLGRLSELKIVRLHVQKGIESTNKTRMYAEEFSTRVERLTCFKQKIKVIIDDSALTVRRQDLANIRTKSAKEEQQTSKHTWIKCMQDFRRLLLTAEKYLVESYPKVSPDDGIMEGPIKIALIDDGADVMELSDCRPAPVGQTFCPRDEENHLDHPWYASASGHGTVMAKLINFMCPRAQLHILRLADYPSPEGGSRQLDARSAAQAITAAVKKGVHIISMSWTIDPPESKKVEKELKDAIRLAEKANILMFCSASDQGAKQMDTYPSKATKNIFTIGAAGPSGEIPPYVGDQGKVEFSFPGDRVEIIGGSSQTATSPGGSSPNEVKSGSSVATALAAGLAGLLLYCVQVKWLLASGSEKEHFRMGFNALKNHEQMKNTFQSTIGTSVESKNKFLLVWKFFDGAKAERISDDEAAAKWISDLGRRLCPEV